MGLISGTIAIDTPGSRNGHSPSRDKARGDSEPRWERFRARAKLFVHLSDALGAVESFTHGPQSTNFFHEDCGSFAYRGTVL